MATRIYHSLDELERDMRTVTTTFKPRMAEQVRDVALDGNRAGRRSARRTAGAHGKHYFKAFGVERLTPLSYEWGPDAEHPGGQGGMSFERGSRNQKPHHDIAHAADVHGAPDLARRANRVLDRLFWP
ncbi:MAG: hypothetical protein ACXWDF_10720 [Aeromicrobium sp.]